MESFTINIKTDGRHIEAFKRLAKAVGATVTTAVPAERPLTLERIIEEGERDFAEGRGTVLSMEQICGMVNHAL